MSGIFLTVWDFTKDSSTGQSRYDEILQNTKGATPTLHFFTVERTLLNLC